MARKTRRFYEKDMRSEKTKKPGVSRFIPYSRNRCAMLGCAKTPIKYDKVRF